MRMLKKHNFAVIVGILTVILFDALQQKYYLDTFQIYPDVKISFIDLFLNHFLRWTIWGFFSFLFGYITWKLFKKNGPRLQVESWVLIIGFMLIVNLFAILTISVTSLIQLNDVFSVSQLGEHILFFLFQKGLSFIFASSLLLLLLHNYAGNLIIDAQLIEIDELKSNSEKQTPTLTIKIGKKIKVIQLNEIKWIEAFDYCVKIHATDKTYTMRNSLKSLQKNLESHNFIRVHRSALINLDFVDHIDFDLYLIKLLSKEEISLSKSGAKEIKTALASKSV